MFFLTGSSGFLLDKCDDLDQCFLFYFQDPQKPDAWSGVLDATKPGPKCFQMSPSSEKGFEGSEDCLYLNVYTPSLPQEKLEKLPVIFFVHGGRYLFGQGDYYRPDYIIDNDVILVTINYRLHILGFLCLHTEKVPGNAAFKDNVMALKWVRNNIKFFNGDENNVTALGESAGSGTVESFLVSKMTDGLVHKIIGQSGTCLSDLLFIEEDPITKAEEIARLLGKDIKDINELYEFLVNEPVINIVSATMTVELSKPPHIINAFFLAVVEKKFQGVERFFEDFPLVTIRKNNHKKLPLITGVGTHDAALFVQHDNDGNISYIKDTQKFIPRFLFLPYDSPKSRKLGRALHEFYFKNEQINDSKKEEYINFLTDTFFFRDILMFCELYNHDKLYIFNFCYMGNMNTRTMKVLGIKGTSHGDIIQYQFYKKSKHEKCDSNDEKIIKLLSETWCNFAKNG